MKEIKREDIESKVIDQLCDYCLNRTDDIMEIFDNLITDHKAVVEKQSEIIGDYLKIKQVELQEEDDKCETCMLNKMSDCRATKSWLVCTHGFKPCELGYNYQEVK